MIKEIHYNDTLQIRQLVLWPNKPLEELYVKGDENATHYGYFLENNLIGVISVFTVGSQSQFRKFAVLPNYQGKGIGTKLLSHVFENNTSSVIWCNARKHAIGFYNKFGMIEEKKSSFYRGKIEYVKMKKRF